MVGIIVLLAFLPRPAKLEASFTKGAELEAKTARMIHGSGTVLQILKFKPTALISFGSPRFESLSIWISDLKESSYDLGDSKNIVSLYTEGVASAAGTGCTGKMDSGKFEVFSVQADYIKIHIESHFICTSDDGNKTEITLDQGYALQPKSVF